MRVMECGRLMVICENERVHNDWWDTVTLQEDANVKITDFQDHTIEDFGISLMIGSLNAQMRVGLIMDGRTPEEIRAIDMRLQEAGIHTHDFVLLSLPRNTVFNLDEQRMLQRFVDLDDEWMDEKNSPTIWERLDQST